MTDYLSRTLHGKAGALNLIKTLKSMRNKVTFSNLREPITKLARGIPDLDEPVMPRRKNRHYYNTLAVLERVVSNAPADLLCNLLLPRIMTGSTNTFLPPRA